MVFVIVQHTFALFDKETVTDMKYQSKKFISIIGFCYADKVLSSGFYRELF